MDFVSWSRRPINVDLPSSTLPTAEKRSKSLVAFCSRNSRMLWATGALISEVSFTLLCLHRALGIMIDHPRASLRSPRDHHLFDDVLQRRGRRPYRARARHAAQTAEPAEHPLALLTGRRAVPLTRCEEPVEDDDLAAADDHLPFAGVVERIDRDFLQIDVLPYVELGPVRERKHTDGCLRAEPGVVEAPELWTLVLGVPLPEFVADRKEALLGAGLLFVPAGPPDGSVEHVMPESRQQGLRLEQPAASLGAKFPGVRSVGDRGLVPPYDQVRSAVSYDPVAKVVHFLELVPRVHVHERERKPARVKRLLRQAQQDGGVLADRVEENGPLELRGNLPQHVNALRLQVPYVIQRIVTVVGHDRVDSCYCRANLLSPPFTDRFRM